MKKKIECEHNWVVSSWKVGEYDEHEYSPFTYQYATELLCTKCFERKDLEED